MDIIIHSHFQMQPRYLFLNSKVIGPPSIGSTADVRPVAASCYQLGITGPLCAKDTEAEPSSLFGPND